MQLNDVIKSISWYQAFVVLPIQTGITKNSTDTDTIYRYQCITNTDALMKKIALHSVPATCSLASKQLFCNSLHFLWLCT